MANVLHKTTSPADYRVSVHTPDFPDTDWFINPDISAVALIPTRYWIVGTNPVQEMTQPQKDAVDAAIVAAAKASEKSAASAAIDGNSGYELRALAQVVIDEINNLRQWDTDLKAAFANNSTLATIRTAVAALSNMPARTLAQAKTAYKNHIAGSGIDE